jgi:uncharacterized membrane protein
VSDALYGAALAAALACGLVGGVLFAFSTFVMPALARLPSGRGIAAMQAINRAAVTPLFMAALLGGAAACAALAVVAVLTWGEPQAAWMLAGGVVYGVGTFLLTIAYHVPRNEALAAVDPDEPEAEERWARYVADWTWWNHVRAVAALVAAGLLTVGLTVG